ncbi:MAG: glycosyltransferase 87 family protein [Elainellaceae cyanobacterium]
MPVLLVPFVVVGAGLSSWLSLPEEPVSAICALVFSILVTAATTSIVALLALRLGSTGRGAYVAAVGFALGTIAPTYAQTLFSEPLLAFLTLASLYLAMGETRRAWTSSILLGGLAILAKPTGIVVGPVLSIYWLMKRRPRAIVLGPFVAIALGTLIYLGYNYLRFNHPLVTGQPVSTNFQITGMPKRFFGLLFGPGMGGGLVWYCPPVILAVLGFRKALRHKRAEGLAIVGILLGYLGIYSFWLCCGWDWGPRFLVPALPGLMALAGLVDYRGRRILIGLTIIGLGINAPTLISLYERYYWEVQTAGANVHALSLWTDLSSAPLFNVWGAAIRQLSDAAGTDARVLLADAIATSNSSIETDTPVMMQIVPVWWWLLPVIGLPVWLGILMAAGLIAAGIGAVYWGWQAAKVYDASAQAPGESTMYCTDSRGGSTSSSST